MRISDWSSDVCSSDLVLVGQLADILGLDNLDDIVGGALFAQRGGKGAADAGNDDRIIARLVGGRVLRKGGRRKHRHGCRAQSEEHTSELQSLMRISYAVFCLKKKTRTSTTTTAT